MKKVSIFMSIAIIAIAAITINSCQKSTSDAVSPANDHSGQSNSTSKMNVDVLKYAITSYMKVQQDRGNLKSGAEFIPAFYTNDGFGIGIGIEISYDPGCDCFVATAGELAFFNTDLDDNDFYRLNPDSSVTVHITSTDAFGTYINIGEGTMAWGGGCNMTMNYSGAWVIITFEFDGVVYTFQFVDGGSNPSAVVWHGAGKVQFNGEGQKHNLVAHLTANQGWTKTNFQININ